MNQLRRETEVKNTLKCLLKDKNDLTKNLISCLNFATEAHKDQKRKDVEKTPYINHPIGVAYITSEEAELSNLDLLRGCLLHDTVEDTAVNIDDIRTVFGDYIASLVLEVTDDKTLPKQKRKDLQVIHAQTLSPQAKVVKLADKLYNLRDLNRSLPDGWSEKRRQEYYEWALKVCNGLRGVSPKLEAKLDELFSSKGFVYLQEPSEQQVDIPCWAKHDELKVLIAAADFAARCHSRHTVFNAKSGLPYINHLVSVVFILSEEADIQNSTMLCAALLCDVVGKANRSNNEIVANFGNEVGKLVDELTYDHSQTIENHFQTKIKQVSSLSDAAKLISIATVVDDYRRLENLEPEGWPVGLRQQYFLWAQQLIGLLTGMQSVLGEKPDYIWNTKMLWNLKNNV